jgi:Zn-dependent protease with chaperone function
MYFLIGISLVFAYLYAVNLGGSLLTAAAWKLCSRLTSRMSRGGRADLLFILRVMPLAAAVVMSLALLIPSFLLFEPHDSNETISYKLALLVAVSILGMLAAASRIFASWWRTRRLTAEWLRNAEPFELPGSRLPAFKIRHPFPVLAVIGVLRPKIFVATQVLDALESDELHAALAHETGHIKSRDNFKRVAMRLCGDMLVLPLGRSLDGSWLEAAESAADEFAAKHSDALDLASALVKIGRITPPGRAWEMPVGAYLTEPEDGSLAARIGELMDIAEVRPDHSAHVPGVRFYKLVPLAILTVLMLTGFSERTLYGVHQVTEAILARLQ